MIDPALIDEALAVFVGGGYDYFSNAIRRTYPDGLDIEAFTRAALDEANVKAKEPFQREHVTPYMRTGAYADVVTGDFRIGHLLAPADFGHLRWTVDTPDDLTRVRRLVRDLPEHYGWLDAIALLTRRPDLLETRLPERPTIRLREAEAADAALLFDWVNQPEKLATALKTRGPISRDTHDAWFAAKLASPDVGIWIAADEVDTPIGQARLERRGDALEVDIYVEPAARCRGAGMAMLDALRMEAARRWPDVPLLARVKPENWASRRLFAKAGYGKIVMARNHMILHRDPARPEEAA